MGRRGTGRRGGGRSGGTAGGAPLYGIGNLDTSNYFISAANAGTPGADTGFFIAYWCRVVTVANSQFWATYNAAAAGWSLRQLAATTLQMRVFDGGGVSRVSTALTLTGLEQKVVAVMGFHSGAGNTVGLYANRASVGTAACTGYTVTAGQTQRIAQQAASGCEFYGMVSGLGVPSLANFQAWCDALKTTRALADMPGVPGEHQWKSGPTLGNLSDLVGSSTLTKTGTGHTLVLNRNPTWAW